MGNRSVLDAIAVLGGGLVAGAFSSRVLAEIPWLEWPFYRWELTLVLTCGMGALLLVVWWVKARPQPEAIARVRACSDWMRPQALSAFVPLYALGVYLFAPAPNLLQAGVLLAGVLALCVLLGMRVSPSHSTWLIALLCFVVPFGAYLCTLMPSVGTRDGYELQAVSATLGFAHPTGYPLFPVLGRLWIAVLPLGTIAWRINVLCALFAAASVPLVYGTVRRVLDDDPSAALSALSYAFSRTLWTQASQPEKYTLNALFVSLVLYVAFGTEDPEVRAPYRHLRWLALVYGLSLTHHRTMLMLAPALVVYVLWRDPSLVRRPREWLTALGYAVAPLLIYLYIPWRAHAQGWAMTVQEFLDYVLGRSYGPAVRLLDWLNPERMQMFWRFLIAQFGYAGPVLGATGLFGLGLSRRWRFLACTVLAYLAYYVWGTVWYAYYNDVNSFIPNHCMMAMWTGAGAWLLWRGCASLVQKVQDKRHAAVQVEAGRGQPLSLPQAVFWSGLAILPMWMVWTHAPQADMSRERDMARWGEYVVGLAIPPRATILADREKHPSLDYFARVEGLRPDVEVVILGDEGAYHARLARDLGEGRPVYLARFLPGLEGRYHLRSLGPLVEVGTAPAGRPPGVESELAGWGISPSTPGIRLLGYQAEDMDDADPRRIVRFTLYWQRLATVPGNYQVALRLVGATGWIWWTAADHPVNGMYPTAAWKGDEIIADWHQVIVPDAVPPGWYLLQVGLFPPFSTDGLVRSDGTQWFTLETVTLEMPGALRVPKRLRVIAPGRWQLLGYELPSQAPPAGRVTLSLYWQSLGPLPDYVIGTRLVSSVGSGDWTWAVPGNGEYPTSLWPPGGTVVTTHILSMPAQAAWARVQVAVRHASQPGQVTSGIDEDGAEAVYPGWLASGARMVSLPPVRLVGTPSTASGTANYGDRILLLSFDLSQRVLTPGAPVELAVRWQCARPMEADYTLFVHILAPDGMLKGQADVWPRDGTHPTSQWREGEVVEDRYRVYVSPDAPPGSYQVEVGWYLLATMQRIPVLDAEGRAIDDRVLLSGLTVTR